MSTTSTAQAPVTVRADLERAHQQAWGRIAAPGTWWTGVQRVAIAAETRHAEDCRLCRERKAALTPNAVSGEHDHLGELPSSAVEAIHRIRTDPGRLSKSWLDGVLDAGLTDAEYVELTGVLVTVVNVDTFSRAVGVAPPDLPQPRAGEPSRHRPASATAGVAWVPMIPRGENTGPEADLYAGGFVANVRRAMSLVPDEVRGFFALQGAHYVSDEALLDPSQSGRAIDRPQIELLAARVSALNECFY